jgi:hypothetical protein
VDSGGASSGDGLRGALGDDAGRAEERAVQIGGDEDDLRQGIGLGEGFTGLGAARRGIR